MSSYKQDKPWCSTGEVPAVNIEITPEMIEAGVEALTCLDLSFESYQRVVIAVYSAMVVHQTKNRKKQQPKPKAIDSNELAVRFAELALSGLPPREICKKVKGAKGQPVSPGYVSQMARFGSLLLAEGDDFQNHPLREAARAYRAAKEKDRTGVVRMVHFTKR